MSQTELRRVAQKYFKAWFDGDRRICQQLAGSDKAAKLDALFEVARPSKPGKYNGYNIARALWTRFDEGNGLERYEPVLTILESLRREQFEGGNLVAAVNDVERRLSEAYSEDGKRRHVLTPATKFLWLKFQSPIIIYDNKVQRVLRTPKNNYAPFCAKWQARYRLVRSDVEAACKSLTRIPDIEATPEYVAKIVANPWFHERVFDASLMAEAGHALYVSS